VERICEEEPEVQPIVINTWPKDLPDWVSRLGNQYKPEAPNTIIIDEAQLTYWDGPFWNSYIKSLDGESDDRIILFASYGSPTRDVSKDLASNIAVMDRARVSLRPVDHGDGIPPAGLFLLKDEFEAMIEKLFPAAYFKAEFLDYVFRITAGHTGAVKDLLQVIQANDVSLSPSNANIH
jgi:hypothetical protein